MPARSTAMHQATTIQPLPVQHLQTALLALEGLLAAAVARSQAAELAPTDALRGLVITDQEIEAQLAAGLVWDQQPLPPLLEPAPDSRLAQLRYIFSLSAIDCAILLLAAAPHYDRRYERLYAYLQDDVSLKRPTVNLALNLLAHDPASRLAIWERLTPTMPLRQHHLLICVPDSSSTSFLAQALHVDLRMMADLLGDATPDTRLAGSVYPVTDHQPTLPEVALIPVYHQLRQGPLVYLKGPSGSGRQSTAGALCAACDLPLLAINALRLASLELPHGWRLAIREGYLAQSALLITDWESILDATHQPPVELWEALIAYPYPVFLCGKTDWEPPDLRRDRRLLRLTFNLPEYPERQRLWREALQPVAADDAALAAEIDELARRYRFTPVQIKRTVQTAVDLAASRGEELTQADLATGAQAHSRLRLGQLARQITPRHTWDDLILPPDRLEQLRELRQRAEHAHTVQQLWGFGRKGAPVTGVNALFAGESGTGKTMSAEIIARDLGLALYKIDLSAVVSKYIGETEKNLSVIFEEAQTSNAILFFDEADALFGKRSEVKDARDRYANIETAYLLQQIEAYDGIAILATNLRQNLDEAFTRRLDFVIDFPFPDSDYRRRIWEVHFPPDAPLADDIDFSRLAEKFALAGGNIRNVALTAAFLAAADGRVITMQHLQHAIRREHQKLGRLVHGEF